MGYSFSKQLTLVENVSIEESIEKALNSLGWRYEKLDIGNYKASIGMGLKTNGERVAVTVGENNKIFIKSKLVWGLYDWGKNKKNVLNFEDTLMNNLVYLQTNAGKEEISKKSSDVSEASTFVENIIKLNKLFIAEIITEEEFVNKKTEKIKELNSSNRKIDSEKFLISLIELKEKNIINQHDIILIKKIIIKEE